MSLILTGYHPATQFDLVDPTSVSEEAFSSEAMEIIRRLHPDCKLFKFNPIVTYDGVRWRPDMALVHEDHRYWFVIEAEIAVHHLEKHILPQVDGLANGIYEIEAAKQLSKNLDISVADAQSLIEFVPRYVAVVSNNPSAVWSTKLATFNVQHVAISTFRDRSSSQTVHKVDGAFIADAHSIGFGLVHATENAISTRDVPDLTLGEFEARTYKGVSKWTSLKADGKIWLVKKGPIEFEPQKYVQILRSSTGQIVINKIYSR